MGDVRVECALPMQSLHERPSFLILDQEKFNNNDTLSIKQPWKATGVQENHKLYKTHSQPNRPQENVRFLPSSIPDIYEQQRLKNRADLKDKSSYRPENLPVVSPEGLHTF